MVPDRLPTVVVAVALLAGLGMTAATIDSSVDTRPDEAIDIDASTVPLGSGELVEYKERLQDGDERDTEPSGDPAEEDAVASKGEGPETIDDAGSGSEQVQAQEHEQELGSGMGPGDPSLLDRLLELLRSLLSLLVSLLPALVVLGALAAIAANRDRFASLLRDAGGGTPATDGAEAGPSLRLMPENDVERAWHEMATLAGVERIETTTPRECAARAETAGADPEAVDRITRTFEEVRYGGAPVTDERRASVREELQEIRTQLGGGA